MTMQPRFKRLNTLTPEWSDISNDYVVGSDGHLYKVIAIGKKDTWYKELKEGYYRGRVYGYRQVRQNFGTNREITIKVHRAVAFAFCPRLMGQTDVDHINNVKSDNRASNLRWLTHRENIHMKKYRIQKEPDEFTYQCPECQAIYNIGECQGHEEWSQAHNAWAIYHICPCCGREILEGYEENIESD